MHCTNCHAALELGDRGMNRVSWQMVEGDRYTALFLPFWRIAARVPVLGISTFSDFAQQTNQPFLVRPEWAKQAMHFWVPAFKLRPKVFVQAAKQATINQLKLNLKNCSTHKALHPVTLPSAEARQSLKLVIAAASTSPRNVFPSLPQVQFQVEGLQLVHLPFADHGHDWVQPATGVAVGKNVLRLGRTM